MCASCINWDNVTLFVFFNVVPVQRVAVGRHVEESHADALDLHQMKNKSMDEESNLSVKHEKQ
jgi:hypothetical protein